MTMNRYESYKDSGIPWLGEVPEHWKTWKITHATDLIGSGTTPKSDNTNYYDGEILWVTTSELRENFIDDTKQKVTDYAIQDYSALKIYPKNSVAIAMYGATIGRLGILSKDATFNQACCVFGNSKKMYYKFLFYWLWYRRPILISLSNGGGQPNLSQDDLKKIKIPLPPLPEQTAITHYLDNKLGEIDALISKQETLLAKLAEQRTAIITHAVTKGLNTNAPMKHSGVAWLGDVPEHWRIIKLGHTLLNLRTGLNPRSNFELNTSDADNYYVTIQELVNDSIKFTDNTDKINDEALKIINNRSVLKIGDILLSGTGTIGKTALISETPKNWNIKEGVYALTPNLNSISSSFLLRLFHAKYILSQMDMLAMGSTVRSVKMADLKFIKIVLPPLPEQAAIAQYLDEQTANIDRLSDTVNQTIARLKEYRSALITQAVTGKIKVI